MNNELKRIIPLGGAEEIGANSYYVEIGENAVILDCGRNPNFKGVRSFPDFGVIYSPKKIRALLISHAHNDHIGALPYVFMKYFTNFKVVNGKMDNYIYMHYKTYYIFRDIFRDICKLNSKMIKEMVSLPVHRSYWSFKKRKYFELFESKKILVDYNEEFELFEGVKVKFFDAGHVLGSAAIYIYTDKWSLLYTGDINFRKGYLMKGASIPENLSPNIMISETTGFSDYKKGNFSLKEIEKRVANLINETIFEKKGHILIPSFALGKGQEIISMLGSLMSKRLIPGDLRIYSLGMVNLISKNYYSAYFKRFHRYYEAYIKKGNIKVLDEILKIPSIIIATSGMLTENTYSHSLAQRLIEDKRNLILFMGYLAHGTMGKNLLNVYKNNAEDERYIFFDNFRYKIKCRIESLRLSSHTVPKEYPFYISRIKPKNVILVHGSKDDVNAGAKILKQFRTIRLSKNSEVFMDKANKPCFSKDVIAVICSVGTSLLNNYKDLKKRTDKEVANPSAETLVKFLKNSPPKEASAEFNTMSKIKFDNRKKIKVFFLYSDSKECHLCALALKMYYEKRKIDAEIIRIEGLVKKYDIFRDIGLVNLVNTTIGIIEKYSDAYIVATGGFKAETSYLNLIGLLYNKPVYYIHTDFDNLVELPVFPVNFDFAEYEKYIGVIQKVLEMNFNDAKRVIQSELPVKMHNMFRKDRKIKGYVLSPVGIAVKRAYEYYKNQQGQIEFKITVEKNLDGLWSSDVKTGYSILDITHKELRDFMSFLYKNYRFIITNVVFRDIGYHGTEKVFKPLNLSGVMDNRVFLVVKFIDMLENSVSNLKHSQKIVIYCNTAENAKYLRNQIRKYIKENIEGKMWRLNNFEKEFEYSG